MAFARPLLALLCFSFATAQLSAQLHFSPSAPPLNRVSPTYVSVNIDTGSLYNDFDFTSSPLRALTAHLASAAPTQLRAA